MTVFAPKTLRRGGTLTAFAVFWLANPAFLTSCSEEEGEEFDFDEADMLERIEVVNGQSWEFDGYVLTVELEQGTGGAQEAQLRLPSVSWVRDAHACGSRSFVKSAAACMATTEMPVEGTLRLVDLSSGALVVDAQVAGVFIAEGKTLRYAWLALSFDSGRADFAMWRESGFTLTQYESRSDGPME
jgi:hypothetical protein